MDQDDEPLLQQPEGPESLLGTAAYGAQGPQLHQSDHATSKPVLQQPVGYQTLPQHPPPYRPHYGATSHGYAPDHRFSTNQSSNAILVVPRNGDAYQLNVNPPRHFLGLSIFVTLCCCLPLGIAAIVFSAGAMQAIDSHDIVTARRKGEIARKLGLSGLILGIVWAALFSMVFFLNYQNINPN